MTTEPGAVPRTKPELTAAIAARHLSLVIPRTARKTYTCTCFNEIRSFDITVTRAGEEPPVTESTIRVYKPGEAVAKAVELFGRYPDSTVKVEPKPNPEYRPGCLETIAPGDPYAEYIGEVVYQGGSRYCSACAVAAWGHASISTEGE